MFSLTTYSSSSSYLIIIITRRIFIIINIIFFLIGTSFSQSSTMENLYHYCGYDTFTNDGFYCGNNVIMKYPFWRMDYKEASHRQYFCGYPGFGITCDPFDDYPVINISNQSYYVTQGNTHDQMLNIVEPDFLEKSCPRPRRNFTTDHQNFSSSSHPIIPLGEYNDNLTIFFNCTSPPPPLPLTDGSYNNRSQDLECLAYNDSMRSYGIFNLDIVTESDRRLLAEWNGNYCRELSVVVPVEDSDIAESDTGINYLIYLKTLQRGFRVGWVTPNECQKCESSGGFCLYNQTKSTYNCLCREEGQLIKQSADHKEYYCFTQPNDTFHADTSMHNKILIIGVTSGFGGLVLIMILLFFVYRNNQKKRLGSITKNVELFLESYGYRSLQRYQYKDIKKMTNSFKDKLGQGGYGSVFKGKLADGRLVAVKVLINDPKKKTNGEDFMNEVATIGRTNHVNIVGLLGYCSTGSKRALVYEFMTNGSLEKFIYAEKEKNITTSTYSTEVHPLGWEKLCQIAIGIARGLEYLHRGCNTGRILHFDIKPHNILLDENFCPKISDFGLAKLCPTRESIVSMLSGGRGTIGYIAPEVYNRNFGGVSYKSDVYSYGMMVLEMVGGRKNIDPFVENTSEIYFPHWIYNHLEKDQDKIEGLLKFEEALEEEIAKKMIMVGLWCIQTHQEHRPTMGKVAEILEGSIEDLQMPPNPFGDHFLHPPPTS